MKKFFVLVVILFCGATAWSQPDTGPGMATLPQIPNEMVFVEPRRIAPEEVTSKLNHPAEKLDLSSPENTVRSFVWAFNNADIKTMRECVLNALPYEKLRMLELLLKRSYRGYNYLVSDFNAYPDGDKATVTLRLLNLRSLGQGMREATCERLHLQRNKNGWLILPDGKVQIEVNVNKANNFGSEDLLASQAATIANAEVVPFLTEKATLPVCQTNLKQVGLGLFQFLQDWDEKYDLHANWKDQLMPYIKSEEVFQCPSLKEGETSYSFNLELENKVLADVKETAFTILFYEGKDQKFDFRHTNETLTNIAFADGHVKAYTRENLDAALKNGQIKWKP